MNGNDAIIFSWFERTILSNKKYWIIRKINGLAVADKTVITKTSNKN